MATATKYSHDDTSAPVLDGTEGSLIDLLDGILVDGYGAKAAAGWTKPFVNANNTIAAYRNSVSGTGTYVKIDDETPSAIAVDARFAQAWGYNTMSDLNTGTDQFPTAADITGDNSVNKVIVKSAVASATAVKWWAYATDKSLFLHIQQGSDQTKPQRSCWYFIGDFIPEHSSDTNNFVLMTRNYGGTTDPGVSGFTGYPTYINNNSDYEDTDTDTYYGAFKQGLDGSVGADCDVMTFYPNPGPVNISGFEGWNTYPDVPYELQCTELYLVDPTQGGGVIRGKLPSFLVVHQEILGPLSNTNSDSFTLNDVVEGNVEVEIYHYHGRFDFDTSGTGSYFLEPSANTWV